MPEAPATPDKPGRPRLRPFAAAHWSLLALLVAAWAVLGLAEPCRTAPFYAELSLATLTVCLALWANHVARAPLRSQADLCNVVLRSIYDVLTLATLLFVLSIAGSMVMPHFECYTDRARVSEMLLSASPLRESIKDRALAQGTLAHAGQGLKVARMGLVSGGLVTEDGVIVIAGEKPLAVMFLTPTLQASQVVWTCVGYPAPSMPAPCRDGWQGH